ncbi:MAG: bifunctional precorrin-2 dehydrogenase/sirohydrochlorin ferrochelatase [Nitrospirae bacterium]|nr:bifunctional precorrin-2 dehydrogenase/sirohydrochlorin ferrochelatase [Nitrospirota bacterium]
MNSLKNYQKTEKYPVYYPAFINLKNKKTVVVGGGDIAERKVLSLLKAEADVTVISPVITKRLEKKASDGKIIHISRKYRKGDIKNYFLVIAATDDREVNERIAKEAKCLVNVVDTPQLCNFIVPSIVKRGHLIIAISTGGISPAMSRTIRKEIEAHYKKEFQQFLKSLKLIRGKAFKHIRDNKKRTEFLKYAGSKTILALLRNKGCKTTINVLKNKFDKYCGNR